jgi:uncharacterized cupin superfamily protein
MLVPPGSGPPPHRYDFGESFTVLAGEIEVTFRSATAVLYAGATANIPANAPHQFRNTAEQPARPLCICAPAGQEELFKAVGVPVASRTAAPPRLDAAAQAELEAKAEALFPRYWTELLPHA